MTSTQDPLQELARIRVPRGRGHGLQASRACRCRPPGWPAAADHEPVAIGFPSRLAHPATAVSGVPRAGDLVARGCRGVRVEVADGERAVRQDATLGFSTSLRYSTARSNPAMPYLRGQADLFIDRISGAGGWIAYEVVPRKGRQPGKITSGLEGGIDAVMNAFGI